MSATKTKLYCFSPPVMLATFAIEIMLVLYVVWRYKMTTITRLVILILAFLAAFQGTEFMLCGGMEVNGGTWSRLGYASISMLPPLGLHLVYAIAGKKSPFLVPAAYLSAAVFIAYFALGVQAISGHTCYANYAVFDVSQGSSLLYSIYYYGWLFIGVGLAYHFGKLSKKKNIRRALYALSLGYLAFIVPTTAVNIVDPATISGIPSIMCGFAVILAFILVGKVAPEAIKQNNHHSLRLKFPL